LIDTHCRARSTRLTRAAEILNTVCKCLRQSGKLTPHEIGLALDGLAARWACVDRHDMTEDGERINKKKKKPDGQ